MERRAGQVMEISEIDLQNRSQTNNHDNANCQLEKRLATVALSTTNARVNRVRTIDFLFQETDV